MLKQGKRRAGTPRVPAQLIKIGGIWLVTTLWSPNVADAVEAIRTLCSDYIGNGVQSTLGTPGGSTYEVEGSELVRVLNGYWAIKEVLDGFQKTFPLEVKIKQAKAHLSVADG